MSCPGGDSFRRRPTSKLTGVTEPAPKNPRRGCWSALGVIAALLVILMMMVQCSANRAPAYSSTPTSSTPGVKYISGDGWTGCPQRETYEQLSSYVAQGDREAFQKLLSSSDCISFNDRDKVYLEEVPPLGAVLKVRRSGETTGYWTAAEAVK